MRAIIDASATSRPEKAENLDPIGIDGERRMIMIFHHCLWALSGQRAAAKLARKARPLASGGRRATGNR